MSANEEAEAGPVPGRAEKAMPATAPDLLCVAVGEERRDFIKVDLRAERKEDEAGWRTTRW